ncbi:nonstructural protein [Microviridae sp.]|nr:nonstructural protein [Microviridae sp.]
MIHLQFSIYDTKAGAYLPPFILPREEMAIRTFGDCINAKDHQFSLHPEDYTLFRLGTWDDDTARFTAEGNGPQTLGNGVEFIRAHSPELNHAAETPPDPSLPTLSDEPPILSGATSTNSSE